MTTAVHPKQAAPSFLRRGQELATGHSVLQNQSCRLATIGDAMNAAIEMHDSKCLAVEVEATGQGSVVLDAYVHRTDGEPGVAPGEGGVQRIRISVARMVVEGEVGDLPADIFEGSLNLEETIQDNMVPFPATYSEPARLSMMLSPDARVVVVAGSGISIEAEGEFRFVETVDGSWH